MRLWPDTLVGRTLAVLLIGVVLSNVAALALMLSERREVVGATRGRWVAEKVAAAAQLLEEAPVDERRRVARSVRGASMRIFWSRQPLLAATEGLGRTGWIRRLMTDELDLDDEQRLRLAYRTRAEVETLFGQAPPWAKRRASGPRFAEPLDLDDDSAVRLLVGSLALTDGSWLNFVTPVAVAPPLLTAPLIAAVFGTTVVAVAASAWAVRRAARPLSALATAAERLGRDVDAPPLAEEGPREVRLAARAFNDMQHRLAAYVRDRTEMLAAISHDLRTPITRLRLRAELIDDAEQQTKTLADLEEMEAMIAATLAFARDDVARERPQPLDLAALLATVCDEAADAGAGVRYDGPAHAPFTGRAAALKRAFVNLVDNAVAYGGTARVTAAAGPAAIIVTVDDDGPGLPEAELERVFEPFRRVEGSRSRDSGGVGLGLAVVRSAARAHGGEVTLTNRPEGGLRATVTLPLTPAAAGPTAAAAGSAAAAPAP